MAEELCFPFAGSRFSCLWGSTAQPAACAAPRRCAHCELFIAQNSEEGIFLTHGLGSWAAWLSFHLHFPTLSVRNTSGRSCWSSRVRWRLKKPPQFRWMARSPGFLCPGQWWRYQALCEQVPSATLTVCWDLLTDGSWAAELLLCLCDKCRAVLAGWMGHLEIRAWANTKTWWLSLGRPGEGTG